MALSKKFTELSSDIFIKRFEAWQEKHQDFLNEKSIDDSGKSGYSHYHIRSARHTFKRNLPYLFTFESVENLPNTNNGKESEFGHLKTALREHSGLKKQNKMKFISNYFALKNDERRLKNEKMNFSLFSN